MKISKTQQLENDIAFCIDECEMTDEEIGSMLRACEQLGGISCEYFAEEFIFPSDNKEEIMRYLDEDYLKINWSLN